MNDDDLELEILSRYVEQHLKAEREDPTGGQKCLRELDLREVISSITKDSGPNLTHSARLWKHRLSNKETGPLRPCSDGTRNHNEHAFNLRAFFGESHTPAWDRIRELRRLGARHHAAQQGHPLNDTMATSIRVFVCHASEDKPLVEGVVALLQSALRLDPATIRCTSVDGHRLPGGTKTNDRLRQEIQRADCFICVVSPSALASFWVVSELGCRWGTDRPIVPLLAAGTSGDLLDGPLADFSALKADNASELRQLVADVAGALDVAPNAPASYDSHVTRIVTLASTPSQTPSTTPPRDPAHVSSATVSKRPAAPPRVEWSFAGGSEVSCLLVNKGGPTTLSVKARVASQPNLFRIERWYEVSIPTTLKTRGELTVHLVDLSDNGAWVSLYGQSGPSWSSAETQRMPNTRFEPLLLDVRLLFDDGDDVERSQRLRITYEYPPSHLRDRLGRFVVELVEA